MLASTGPGTQNDPTNSVTAASPSVLLYAGSAPDSNLAPTAVGPTGGSQPHTNFQPYLCVDFIISLFGIFPSPT
jgi:microcystin-dependent protein